MLITEMAAVYKQRGMTLWQFMQSLYEKYGFYLNRLDNFAFEGESGMETMAAMMEQLRSEPPAEINGSRVVWTGDYRSGVTTDGETGLPKSNVLSYRCENGDSVIVRPSGTEPKIKVYITAKAETREQANQELVAVSGSMKQLLGIKE